MTLYAKWTINQYTITFNTDGGSLVNPITQDYNSEISAPEDPIKEGYAFEGWYLDETYTQRVLLFITMPAEDLTLYAKWKEVQNYAIALVTDVGTIDDNSYNEAAWNGVVRYAQENNMSYQYYRSEDSTLASMLAAIDEAVTNQAKIVVCAGFLFEVAIFAAQVLYPDVSFFLMDGIPNNADWSTGSATYYTAQNTHNVLYQEEQAGFLAGYAVVMEGYTQLGFIGGMQVPAVVRYGSGFIQGAEYAAETLGLSMGTVQVKIYYANSFSPDPGVTGVINSWYNSGTEVIFSCAGGILMSVIEVAESTNNKVIATDVDASALSDSVLTSAMKFMDQSVYDALTAFYNNGAQWPVEDAGQETILGAVTHDVGLPTTPESWRFQTFTIAEYEAIYALLADGTIHVDDAVNLPTTTLVEIIYE